MSVPSCVRRVISALIDRIWIGEQAAMVPIGNGETSLWRRPWLTGIWASSTLVSTFAEAVVKRP